MSRVNGRTALIGAAIAGALLSPAAAQTGARQSGTVLMSENEGGRANQEEYGYSSAVVTGDFIFLSGVVVGFRSGETDMAAAYDRVYRALGDTLKRAGANWDDVVDMTSYHTDVEGQIETMAAVHKKYVKPPYPAWTAIGVSKVLGNGIAEIKITARRPAAAK